MIHPPPSNLRPDVVAARRRFDRIGELIRTGNVADLTPEARDWFINRAWRLEAFAINTAGTTAETSEELERCLT